MELLIIIGIQFVSLGLLGELIIKSNSKSQSRALSIFSSSNIHENSSN